MGAADVDLDGEDADSTERVTSRGWSGTLFAQPASGERGGGRSRSGVRRPAGPASSCLSIGFVAGPARGLRTALCALAFALPLLLAAGAAEAQTNRAPVYSGPTSLEDRTINAPPGLLVSLRTEESDFSDPDGDTLTFSVTWSREDTHILADARWLDVSGELRTVTGITLPRAAHRNRSQAGRS